MQEETIEIIGNDYKKKEIADWFYKIRNDKNFRKILVISGPTGIGKHTIVNFYLKKFKFIVSEISSISIGAQEIITKTKDTFFINPRIIVVEDLGSMTPPYIYKNAKVPVIIYSNIKIKRLSKKNFDIINFEKIPKNDLVQFLLSKTNGSISLTKISELLRYNSDVRNILINLDTAVSNCKNIFLDNFSIIKLLFRKKLDRESVNNIINENPKIIRSYMFENYLNEKINLDKCCNFLDIQSFLDITTLCDNDTTPEFLINGIISPGNNSRHNSKFKHPFSLQHIISKNSRNF
jgi:hypothetical protein